MRHWCIVLAFIASGCAASSEIFPRWDTLSDFEREWYSNHLRTMGERALEALPDSETIRFTWLRTFHRPIMVRIDCGEACTLRAVRLSGAGGYDPGSVEAEEARYLTDGERQRLNALLVRAEFWDGPDPEYVDPVITDGSRWIIEGARGDAYVVWDIHTPEHDRQFRDFKAAGEYLLSLSGFDLDPIY